MHIEGDLVAGRIAAVADDLDVAFLAHGRVSARRVLAPQLDLHNVGLEVVQHKISVNDGLQLFKQRVALLGIIGADLALLLVAVDDHRGLAEDVGLFLDIGRQLRGVFLQILPQTGVACLTAAKGGVQVVGHVSAFNFHCISSV